MPNPNPNFRRFDQVARALTLPLTLPLTLTLTLTLALTLVRPYA